MTNQAFAYIRVSSDIQVKDGYGLRVQQEAIEKYAKQNNLVIEEIFSEEGVSGTLRERPALVKLLNALSNGRVCKVVILRLDRLARDLLIQENLIADFQKRGAELLSVDEPDLCSSDPTRKLFRQMKGAIAEYEKAMITLRMSAGRMVKASQGKYAGGAVPFGFRITNGQHEPIVEKVEVVRRIFNLRRKQRMGKQLSLRKIADLLNSERVPSPKGLCWNAQSINRILKNEIYRGTLKYTSSRIFKPQLKILSR